MKPSSSQEHNRIAWDRLAKDGNRFLLGLLAMRISPIRWRRLTVRAGWAATLLANLCCVLQPVVVGKVQFMLPLVGL